MFKVFFLLLVSTLIPTNISDGSSSEEYGDEPKLWPYINQELLSGKLQSPVNIEPFDSYKVSLPSLLYFRYWRNDSVKIRITNSGHAVHIHSLITADEDVNNTSAHITGGPLFQKKYTFSHIHLYWGAEGEEGSEHQINSKGYPMEVQMIHYKNEYGNYEKAIKYTDGICIISYFGKFSDQDNPKMDAFITAVEAVQYPKLHTYFFSTFDIHFHWLMDVAKDYCYYAYPGSITVDPYHECVTWIIYENTFNISSRQLAVFRSLKGKNGNLLTSINRRTLQSFNNRPLYYV